MTGKPVGDGGTDAPGPLHHIMIGGIERRKIFWDDTDRDSFVEQLKEVLPPRPLMGVY